MASPLANVEFSSRDGERAQSTHSGVQRGSVKPSIRFREYFGKRHVVWSIATRTNDAAPSGSSAGSPAFSSALRFRQSREGSSAFGGSRRSGISFGCHGWNFVRT